MDVNRTAFGFFDYAFTNGFNRPVTWGLRESTKGSPLS